MKKEKIEELFKQHATAYYDCGCDDECCDCEPDRRMYLGNFTHAINQAELGWYKKLEMKLIHLKYSPRHSGEYLNYIEEIQNKIKELEK